MPRVTIDNTAFEFEGRPLLLQFCLDHGIELAHFCYHPAMSVPANCRQCLVDVGMPLRDRATGEIQTDSDGEPLIRFFPKLQTSCSLALSDGMVVHTPRSSKKVARAQRDTMEFLLINHPLDCPICDQAGHCPLQIQAYKYGPEGSRFEFHKTHKPKKVKLGPRVILDAERCINCTRCVRFTDEISKSHQLTIIERGVKNYPMTPPGATFDEPYSMNVIDVCPVGALTSVDFRFRARIWEMSKTPSIITTGAKGSNCWLWVRDNLVLRVTPRPNPDVNKFWLPDVDRLDYDRFNSDRPSGPLVRGLNGTALASWDDAFGHAARILTDAGGMRTLFLASAMATVEDNYLLKRLAESLGGTVAGFLPHVEVGRGDGWLLTDDLTPNAEGCRRLGIDEVDVALLRAQLRGGSFDVVYVLEDDPVRAGLFAADDLRTIAVVLHHTHTTNRTLNSANVALPAATVAETAGTFVNQDARAQRVVPAKAVRGVSRTLRMYMGLSRADTHGTPFDRWHNEAHQINCRPSWDILPAVARKAGVDLTYPGPKQVMDEIAATFDTFADATWDAMQLSGVQLAEAGVTQST